MQAFTTLTGLVAALDRVNVDTDQIVPKQFLKTIKRTGLREGLFFDWKKQKDGSPDPTFFLNLRLEKTERRVTGSDVLPEPAPLSGRDDSPHTR